MAHNSGSSRNRRRASIGFLVPTWFGVPNARLCPSEVPNKAMGDRVPHRRMVLASLRLRRTIRLDKSLGRSRDGPYKSPSTTRSRARSVDTTRDATHRDL